MKSYTPEKLVAISRYREFFPTLPAEIQQDVYQCMRMLLTEEQQYCDKGNYKHADPDLHCAVSLIAGTRKNGGRSLSDRFNGNVESADAGYVPKDGQAFLVYTRHEEDPAVRVPARIRHRLEV